MTQKSAIEEEKISRLLLEVSDEEPVGSDSEAEDEIIQDVQCNSEDEEVKPLLDSEDGSLDPSLSNHLEILFSVESSSILKHSVITPSQTTLKGTNNRRWTATKEEKRDRKSFKTASISRGPSQINQYLYDPLSCFNIFVTDEIIEEITRWTNVEIQERFQMTVLNDKLKATYRETNVTEIRALIGILALTAGLRDNHLSTVELFDCSYSGSRYVAAMSRDRFDFLILCLRMDDKTLRSNLRATDIFVPIRQIWEMFIHNCRENYVPGPYVTIDQQFLCFRGKCPFRMYVPNQSGKYGIKIVTICDSVTHYMLDAMPYLGKWTQTNRLPLGEYFVKELTTTIHGSYRNVTCDSSLTSVPLADSLLQSPYNLTLVGTIRSSKQEIPKELIKDMRSTPVGSSMFCYDGPLTLVSYKPKKDKLIMVLSSRDEEGTVDSTTKPTMLSFYNKTKGGANTFDTLCSRTSCSRKTNRWPLAIFYGILNMAFVNSYVIYCHNVSARQEKPQNRRDFMKELSNSLMAPWLAMRQEIPTLTRHLREKIGDILPQGTAESSSQEDVSLPRKRKYCSFCPSKLRRMTKTMCDRCNAHICGEHKTCVCYKCLQDHDLPM